MSNSTTELGAYFIDKSEGKQMVYRKTVEGFELLKSSAKQLIDNLQAQQQEGQHSLDLQFSELGSYECEMRFAGDALVLQMHTNVFAFPDNHAVHQSPMVKEDAENGYCGMILVYNFLADSLRYNRFNDVGYLLARIFINKEGHFIVEGRRQFAFLYQTLHEQVFSQEKADELVSMAVKNAIDFDLYVPPFDSVKEISLQQKVIQQGNTAIKTGKRLGFIFGMQDET